MKFYRKQPIEAEQFDGSDEMIEKYSMTPPMRLDPEYTIQTSDGHWVLEVGNWIINEADEIKVVADEEFKQQYAELPVVPKAVADWIGKCKHDGIAIASAMDEHQFNKKVSDYFKTYYTRDQWIKLQDDFARAWLDGYVVEEEK